MQREIIQAMSALKKTQDDGLSANFSFPREFIGFQGHFDNNPVLPGICKIQSVLAMFEEFHNRPFRLKEIRMAKYLSPVTCGQAIRIECSPTAGAEGVVTLKAAVNRGDVKVALLHLIIETAPK